MSSAAQKVQVSKGDAGRGYRHSVAGQAGVAGAAALIQRPESIMPWDTGLMEDRRFKRWLMHGAGVCGMFALLVLLFPTQKTIAPVKTEHREQYARLVIEEKFVPPPIIEAPKPKEPPVVETKKPAPEKVEPKKPVSEKTKPVVKNKPAQIKQPVKPSEAELRAKAREKAASTGLLALSDQLADMRQKVNTSSVKTLKSGGDKATNVKRKVIAAKADGTLTGGASVSAQSAAVDLAGREQAELTVSQAVIEAVESTSASTEYAQSRSADEVRRVMDASKGAIYSLYNRALRKNPGLEGSFGFSMTIEPSGTISSVALLNSELNDPALEKRLLARIRMIKFDAADVGVTDVNYSFDFLPY